MINVGFQCRPSPPIDLWSRPPFVLLQSVLGWASIIIIRQNRIFLVDCTWGSVRVCLFISVFPELCVSVLRRDWVCCYWVYRGWGALLGMSWAAWTQYGHILGTTQHGTERTGVWSVSSSVMRAGQWCRSLFGSGNFALQMASSWDAHTHTHTRSFDSAGIHYLESPTNDQQALSQHLAPILSQQPNLAFLNVEKAPQKTAHCPFNKCL